MGLNRTRLLSDLSAAARMLGEWWLQDRASFAQVTLATGRIQDILRDLDEAHVPAVAHQAIPVIFASVPGEQHTLGVRVAAEIFRDDGWEITLKIGCSENALIEGLRQTPRCIVGLSIGGQHSLRALGHLANVLKRACPNAALVACGQDIDAIRPQLSALNIDVHLRRDRRSQS